MPKSSEDRFRIVIDEGSAFGLLTESVTGSLIGAYLLLGQAGMNVQCHGNDHTYRRLETG